MSYTIHPDGNVSYAALPPPTSIMQCSGGWEMDASTGILAPMAEVGLRVFGSYSQGVLKFEDQRGWSMNVTTYSCSGPVVLMPATQQGGFDGPQTNWHAYYTAPLRSAPGQAYWQAPALKPQKCIMPVFDGTSGIPYTGGLRLKVTITDPAHTVTWYAGTFVAGHPYNLLPNDTALTHGKPYCNASINRSAYYWTAEAFAMIQTLPESRNVGQWKVTMHYCEEDEWTCRAEAHLI